ncbi:MAG TPA: PQQ-binding-like beta-propeller repeat protein, partial [Candidatus Eisenbacteria bacterium]|nr:PQQ-binding-like beta-propeller repeat protein [Candidatus Eisenbacteria bacterium]
MKRPLSLLRSVTAWIFLPSLVVAGNDWPQWHGPTRDARIPAGVPVPASLPKDLKPVWKVPIGGGPSSPVVARGKLVYFDEDGQKEVVHCVDATTGKEIWKLAIADRYQDEWGAGPRSTPVIDGDRVYVQSCNGEFRCLNLADGKVAWGVSFDKDYGVKFLGSKA